MIKLYMLVIIPLIVAVFIYLFKNRYMRYIALSLQGILLIYSIKLFIYVRENQAIIEKVGGWDGFVGITLKLDKISAIMLTLTSFLFFSMIIFNLKKKYIDNLFLFLFLVLQALLIGIFISNDLFNIYILVELSAIVVSILIMFKKDSMSIYDGIFYLLVNTVGMAFFLLGIGFLYKIFGVLELDAIKDKMHLISSSKQLILPYSLIITGVCIKSALMPVFAWLPKAHATKSAPSIVSAILSGLYIKTGIYLFIRVQDMFSPVIDASTYFLILGFLTAIIGFVMALTQKDLKLILAYHSISQIGLIMIGLNSSTDLSYWGAIYHIINHSFFKSTLFLTAGMIIDVYKTRDVYEIRGVFKRMPIVSIATILAILGITGAPFFNGSISKYLIESSLKGNVLKFSFILVNFGTILSFLKYSSIFKGKSVEVKEKTSKNSGAIIIIFSLLCLLGGVFGGPIIKYLFNQDLVIGEGFYLKKIVIYGINILLALLIYNKVLVKMKILVKIRELKVSFNDIALLITIFFSITMIYLNLEYYL